MDKGWFIGLVVFAGLVLAFAFGFVTGRDSCNNRVHAEPIEIPVPQRPDHISVDGVTTTMVVLECEDEHEPSLYTGEERYKGVVTCVSK